MISKSHAIYKVLIAAGFDSVPDTIEREYSILVGDPWKIVAASARRFLSRRKPRLQAIRWSLAHSVERRQDGAHPKDIDVLVTLRHIDPQREEVFYTD